jgi:uncharacterized protein (TIGR02453 family)
MVRRPPADLDAPPPDFEGFTPASFTFLHGLKKNNNKPWFEEHRDVYERELRQPMTSLLGAISREFHKLGVPVTASPNVSLFRIYRDIRFSKDKSPYKTHVGLWMPIEGGSKETWTGFYFGMEPAAKAKQMKAFVGGGAHMPPSPELKKIRAKIAGDHKTLERLLKAPAFRSAFPEGLKGESLTRVPTGFAADHPAAEWLKMKSFWAGHDLTDAELRSPELPSVIAKTCKAALPVVQFLRDV